MADQTSTRCTRRVRAVGTLVLGLAAFTAGSFFGSLWQPVRADVTPGQPRTTFLDGGVIANATLQEQLVVIKRLDERVARIEKALLEAVRN